MEIYDYKSYISFFSQLFSCKHTVLFHPPQWYSDVVNWQIDKVPYIEFYFYFTWVKSQMVAFYLVNSYRNLFALSQTPSKLFSQDYYKILLHQKDNFIRHPSKSYLLFTSLKFPGFHIILHFSLITWFHRTWFSVNLSSPLCVTNYWPQNTTHLHKYRPSVNNYVTL